MLKKPEKTFGRIKLILKIFIIIQILYFTYLTISGIFNLDKDLFIRPVTVIYLAILTILLLISYYEINLRKIVGTNLTILVSIIYIIMSIIDIIKPFMIINKMGYFVIISILTISGPMFIQLILSVYLLFATVNLRKHFKNTLAEELYLYNKQQKQLKENIEKIAKPEEHIDLDLPDSIEDLKRKRRELLEFEEYNKSKNKSNNI